MKKNKKNSIGDWLTQHGNPEIDIMVKLNLAIATKVARILEEKGIGKREFAEKMGKSPSEVSKWLSGTHNFTIKTIAKIEHTLDEELIHVEKEFKYLDFIISKSERPKESFPYRRISVYAN